MASIDTNLGPKPQGSTLPYRGAVVPSTTDVQSAIDAAMNVAATATQQAMAAELRAYAMAQRSERAARYALNMSMYTSAISQAVAAAARAERAARYALNMSMYTSAISQAVSAAARSERLARFADSQSALKAAVFN